MWYGGCRGLIQDKNFMQLSETTSALLWCTSQEHAQSLVSMNDPAAVVDAINAAFVSVKLQFLYVHANMSKWCVKCRKIHYITFPTHGSLTPFLKMISLPPSLMPCGTPWESSALKLLPLTSCRPWPPSWWSLAELPLHSSSHMLQTTSRTELCLLGMNELVSLASLFQGGKDDRGMRVWLMRLEKIASIVSPLNVSVFSVVYSRCGQ